MDFYLYSQPIGHTLKIQFGGHRIQLRTLVGFLNRVNRSASLCGFLFVFSTYRPHVTSSFFN